MAKMNYKEPELIQLNSDTYLQKNTYMWTGNGCIFVEEFLIKSNRMTKKDLSYYGENTSKIYSEDTMVIYQLDDDFLDIKAVIDLHRLEELPLSKKEQLEVFQSCLKAQIPPRDDLDIEVLEDTPYPNKKKVYFKNY